MTQYFDFSGRGKSEKIIRRNWAEFRDELAYERFKYDEVDKAKDTAFLGVFNKIFCNGGMSYLTKTMNDISSYSIGRGAKLCLTEAINYERFIPKKEYITEHNRFSPPGEEWLYLSIGNDSTVIGISKKEIKIIPGDRFGFCYFNFDSTFLNKKLVDLTIADEISYLKLENALENYAQQCALKGIIQAVINRDFSKNDIDKNSLRNHLIKWLVYIYSKLLSEQIFTPIVTSNKKLEYAPFQTMAQYFISLKYDGIIYKSTVFDGGKNIVLFDKSIAYPKGTIIDEVI